MLSGRRCWQRWSVRAQLWMRMRGVGRWLCWRRPLAPPTLARMTDLVVRQGARENLGRFLGLRMQSRASSTSRLGVSMPDPWWRTGICTSLRRNASSWRVSFVRPWRLLHRWTRMQAAKTSWICLRIIMVRSLMGLKCILSSDPASKRSRRLQLSTSNVFTYWPSRLPSEMGWGRRISHGRWSANSRMVVRMRICLVGLAYETCVRTTLYFRLVICSFSCVQRSPDVERRNSVWKRGMPGQTCLRSRRATWQQRWHLFNRRLRPWLYNCKVRQHRGPRLWLLHRHLMHSLALSLHQCYSPINIKAMAQALSVVK